MSETGVHPKISNFVWGLNEGNKNETHGTVFPLEFPANPRIIAKKDEALQS